MLEGCRKAHRIGGRYREDMFHVKQTRKQREAVYDSPRRLRYQPAITSFNARDNLEGETIRESSDKRAGHHDPAHLDTVQIPSRSRPIYALTIGGTHY